MLFKGFGSAQFHFKVSDTSNTVVIVKTNSNYVFGGYTRANWNAAAGYAGDFNAFLFTLRRNGTTETKKFNNVGDQDRSTAYNIYTNRGFGPSFGSSANDLKIVSYSNIYADSTSNLGYTYQLPAGCTYGSTCAKSLLAGSNTGWLTTEIEVYEMIDPITTSVRPGMNFFKNKLLRL